MHPVMNLRFQAHCSRCRGVRDFQAVEVRHFRHFCSCLVTCGLWGFVWLTTFILSKVRPWRCVECGWHKPEIFSAREWCESGSGSSGFDDVWEKVEFVPEEAAHSLQRVTVRLRPALARFIGTPPSWLGVKVGAFNGEVERYSVSWAFAPVFRPIHRTKRRWR